ncbi:MAG: hypothetical protein OXE96_15490 [Gemmatimonadetes bacterium]|nr:hypothetical protein [Gemmatimonadota bacterium]
MSINLADDAIHALNRAAAAAAREGMDSITPRHVLAGIISQGDPDLLRVLDRLGLDPHALPQSMRNLPQTYEGHLPFTPASHDVLGAAVGFESGSDGIATTSGHLLLGVVQAGDPESRAALEPWGLDEAALERALRPEPSGAAVEE